MILNRAIKQEENEDGKDCNEDEDEDEDESIQPDEHEQEPLRMYYVSPWLARRRTEGVHAGWYVAYDSDNPKSFDIVVSPLHGQNSVARTVRNGFDVVLANMEVNGQNLYEDMVFDDADNFHEMNRSFQFYSPEAIPEGKGDGEGQNLSAGEITLFLEQGKYGGIKRSTRQRHVTKKRKRLSLTVEKDKKRKRTSFTLKKAETVNEEKAYKLGVCVGVSRDEDKEDMPDNVCDRDIKKRERLLPSITIFIRPRFWLRSRRIIENTKLTTSKMRKNPMKMTQRFSPGIAGTE